MSLDNSYEQKVYEELSRYLREKDFKKFVELKNKIEEKDFSYNPYKIESRFEILSNLLMDTITNVSKGYDTSALGIFIEILRFFNDQHLLERKLREEDQKIIRQVKKDKIFLANLIDLFGKITNSFIFYIIKDIPQQFHDFFINTQYIDFPDLDSFIYYVKNVFFNQYTIYGLSIHNLGTFKKFLKEFQQELKRIEFHDKIKDTEFIELDIKYKIYDFYNSYGDPQKRIITKKHLIYPKNVLKYMKEHLGQKVNFEYKFHSLSMVLLGGIGPQGHGFTYSTPRGEVIEICSDTKENEAIIIKYKLFLKEQFISRLEKELNNINAKIREKIISVLNRLITPNEIIGYKKRNHILSQIKTYLLNFKTLEDTNIDDLFNQISEAIYIIIRPIRMVDQFKARMDLVSREKLKSEDIAKLTSLRNKSHYDVLRERLFFQYIIDLFYDIYQQNK
jgi:hypothetical protein